MKADLVIILSQSGSVGKENFFKMTQFVKSLIETININLTRVSVIIFSTDAKVG